MISPLTAVQGRVMWLWWSNKSGLFSCPAILPYCHSACEPQWSVCLVHCISSCLSLWLFDILLTFWTNFVLITKLKNLSVCLSVFQPVFLSLWHPVDILNKFCFEKSYDNRARLNKVLTRENLLNFFWWLGTTQTSFEHDRSKSWNQLLDLPFDRRMCKTLRMVLRQ